jgi:probable rRNA maturation factor
MISVEVIKKIDCPVAKTKIQRAVQTAARFEKKINAAVEIQIISDAEMKDLNRRYRGLNKTTDVLSFSWQEDTTFPGSGLGQIYISYAQIVRQAPRFTVSAEEEFFRMLTHGLLHLVGHDHIKTKEAAIMFALQEKIVNALKKKN